jgi:phytoene dehydrogenase-like protein
LNVLAVIDMSEKIYDTVVVGGGIAGLTATTYLARQGQKALLIEKNKEPGGLVNTFSHNGFYFDAGVRALLDAGIVLTMLKDLNIKLDLVKSAVSIGIEDEVLNIKNIDSLWEYSNLLKKFYPQSDSEIDEVIRIIRKIMKHMDVLYGIENPVFKDLKRDLSFIFKKILPWFPRFIFTVRKINRMNAPVEDYLQTIIKDPSLRDMISQHFFRNTPAFFALSYFSLYLDYFYPIGGMGKLSESLHGKLLEFGGELRTETRITRVLPKEHLVIDDQDNCYKYKNLIWAADLKTLYNIAEIETLPPAIETNIRAAKTNILKNRGGDSVFTLFLEVDEPLESFSEISHGHFFYTPSRQGLGETHRKDLMDLLTNFSETSKEQILTWLDKFISRNTFEISVPGLRDPEMVPAGKTGLIISFLAEYDLFKKIKEAGWLDQFITEIEDRTISVISNSIYPMLKDKIIARFSFSPLSIENRIGSSEGGIIGWAFEEQMPVINKIQHADRSVFTPFPSIYQAGQWVYSPGGVPMSILTGKLAADQVLKNR